MPWEKRWQSEAACVGWGCVHGFVHVNYKGMYTERHGCTLQALPHTH